MNKNNRHSLRVLLISADQELSALVKNLAEKFQGNSCRMEWKKSRRTGLKGLMTCGYDVCLVDYRPAAQTDLSLIREIIAVNCRTPIILLTDEGDEQLHLEAMRAGAAWCLEKTKVDAPLLETAVNYAVERVGSISELRENVARFRNLVETLPVMIYVAEPKPPYAPLYISPAFEGFGYPLEDWNSCVDFWVQLLHPEDRGRILRESEAMMNAGLDTDLEYRMITREGDVRWVHDRGHFVRGEGGRILCWQGVILDITNRWQAEKDLRDSEAQFKSAFEDAAVGMAIASLDGRWIRVNQQLCEMLGYTKKELTNRRFVELTHPDDIQADLDSKAHFISGRSLIYQREKRYLHKNGNIVWSHLNTSLVKDENGKPTHFISEMQDITERKQALEALRESEARYRDIFENASDLIYTRDLDGKLTSINRAGEGIFGYTREEMFKMNISQMVAPEYLEKSRQIAAQDGSRDSLEIHEIVVIAKDGRRITLELSPRLIKHNGVPIGIQGIARNVTERKRTEAALIESERRYRLLSEGIKHHVWTAGPDGYVNHANSRTLEYLGLTLEQLFANTLKEIVHADDLPEALKRWNHSIETGEDFDMEYRLLRHDGKYLWHRGRATAAFDTEGKVSHWFGTNSDMNDKKLAEAQLSYNALHDTLTNLPNRVKFMNHLHRAIKRTAYNPSFCFAVLFLDLDRFKLINDSLGHSVGDQLLVAIGERIELAVRPGDIVARLGGDEFTVLLFNIGDVSDAVHIANRILEQLAQPFHIAGYEVFTSASVGIIVSDEVPRQPEDYLRDADTAMYRAKETGKARYEIFDREMHIRNMNLLQLENDLRRAIEQDEFRLYYQPIVRLDTGETQEFEALIRWQHPTHGLVAPNDFIGMAEETGLIIPIGEWVLREACRQTAEWKRRFPRLTKRFSVSVNLSAKQLMHPDLVTRISEILEQTELNPQCLKLEVTESIVLENSDKALAVMAELHSLNISLSTDDFGTGYSSLSYLHRFPFDCLKIDRSFISKMNSDQKSEAIVRTILLLAENLNIETVAEGIETERQLKSLRQLGCKTGQGYLFSKPVSAEIAENLLLNNLESGDDESFYGFDKTENHQLLELHKIQ